MAIQHRGVIDRLEVSIFDINPSKIVLMIGTNDVNFGVSNSQIIENYINILDRIKARLPEAELYFMSLIPQNKDLVLLVDFNNQRIEKLNSEIKSLAESYGYAYIDLNTYVGDDLGYLDRQYSDDGLHLNDAGYRIWTNLLKLYLYH